RRLVPYPGAPALLFLPVNALKRELIHFHHERRSPSGTPRASQLSKRMELGLGDQRVSRSDIVAIVPAGHPPPDQLPRFQCRHEDEPLRTLAIRLRSLLIASLLHRPPSSL
ncbi:MAG: hypothetical protein AAB844_01470, partial [Patescibacteria group bacterium]